MSDQVQETVDLNDLADALTEDAPLEDEGQAEPEDAEAEEQQPEAQEEPAAEPERYRVTVKNERGEDEEKDLSLEELAEGYMLSADYTRKRQAEAEQTRQIQYQAHQAIATERANAAESIGQLQQLVLQRIAPELNQLTPQLAQTDPAEYVRLQALQAEVSQLMHGLDRQRGAYLQQAEQIEAQTRQQFLESQRSYVQSNVPDYGKTEFNGKLVEFAASAYGVPKDVIGYLANAPVFKDGQVFDSGRFIHVLNDAMQWRNLQQQKPTQMKKVAAAPKVIKPAAPQPKQRNAEAAKRLKQSGRVEDLASFL